MSKKFKARVIADGRITLPLTLRELLGIDTGNIVEVQLLRKVQIPSKGIA